MLDKVIDSSLDKENVGSEVASSYGVESFDDFKEMMKTTYSQYETKIKAELSKKQDQRPHTVLVAGAKTYDLGLEAGPSLERL